MSNWKIDNTHSGIHFTVRHMVFAKVRGQFGKFTANFALDEANFAASSVDVEIDAASISTNDEQRDGHLKSPDFFDVAQFPAAHFKSKTIEGTPESFAVTGDFTLHGVTREIVLTCEKTGGGKDPWGNTRALFTGKSSINRKDFGLSWNQALETGGVLVSEKVDLEVEIQAVQSA